MNNIATKLSAHERPSVIDSLQKGSQKDNIRRVTQVSHITHQKIRKDGPKNKTTQQPQKDMKTECSRLQKKKKQQQCVTLSTTSSGAEQLLGGILPVCALV